MMAYFRFQFHQLLTNRKNLAVIGIALVALICQFVFFPPNTTPVELPTATVLSRDRDKNIAFVNESHGPNTAVWVPSTREFAKIETHAQSSPFHYPLTYYYENRQYPDADAAYANVVLTQSLIPLAKQAHPDVSTIHQQTFWQTLFRGALGGWLTALLLITILLANDLLTSEQRHRSIARSLPLSPWHAINTKTLTVLGTLAGAVTLLIGVTAVCVIPFHGLGSLTTAISNFAKNGSYAYVQPLALGSALLMMLGLTVLLMWLFIRLNLLCQLLFHNELIGLVLSALLLFGEPLYFMQGLAFSVPQTAYYLPSYMNPAAIVNGLQNFRYDTGQMTPLSGVIVIGSVIVLLEIMLFIVTHRRHAATVK